MRVAAASARTTRFPLANLLLARRADTGAAWRFEPALIAARSPGSWADGLAVATRVTVQSVQVRPVGSYDGSLLSVDVLGPPALAIRTGDLLRLILPGDWLVHTRIAELDAPVSPGGSLRRRVRLRGVCAFHAGTAASLSAAVSSVAYFEPTGDGAGQVEHRVAAQGQWVKGDFSVRCRVAAGRAPRTSAVLRLRFADTASAWLQVTESVLTHTGDADGSVGVELSGQPWHDDGSDWRSRLEDWIGDHGERPVEWLRLDLRARDGGEPDFTVDGIGMAAPADAQSAGMGITTLPDDQRFFRPAGENTRRRPGVARLRTDPARQRRPPDAPLSARVAAG